MPELRRYERYDGQLCLFNDMNALAKAINERGNFSHKSVGDSRFAGTVGNALPLILNTYRTGVSTP
jgi:hypothetical protein